MTTQINFRLCRCHLNRNLPSLRRGLSTSQLKKHYDILNVTSRSTLKEIKESFLRLSKVYHPDNKLTGSHNKFVELKDAYDALKDGHPATTSDTTRTASYRSASTSTSNSYSSYDDFKDLGYGGSAYHRNRKAGGARSFGGPFYNSQSPWEDMRRAQRAENARDDWNRYGNHKPSGPVSMTLTLSAVAWVIIFACASMFWDLRVHRSREKMRQQREMYMDRMQEIKDVEEAIKRRAMVKRAQRYKSSSEPQIQDQHQPRNEEIRRGQEDGTMFGDVGSELSPEFAINK